MYHLVSIYTSQVLSITLCLLSSAELKGVSNGYAVLDEGGSEMELRGEGHRANEG